ncbi:hypothetical protein R3I94_003887 [Phoxinus phoxinus]
MKFPLIVCVFLLTVSSSLSVDITVRGTEGREVNITCRYPEGYENSYKYFYKGIYRERVIIIQSHGIKTSPRFSLKDDPQTRSFTVTISDLKMEDAGPYGCGAGYEHYLQIRLNVFRAPVITTRVQISTSSISPYTNSSTEHTSTATRHTETETTRTTTGNTTVQLYQTHTTVGSDLASVAGGLGSVLLVLTLCSGFFIILKKRKRKSGTALFQQNMQQNTETERMYEEIPNDNVTMVTSSSNQTPASSSNQTTASHLNTRPKVSTVYARATNQQPDSNPGQTFSTNQVTDTPGDYYAKIKSPEATQDSGTELIYVTATHPQNISTNEGPIYSVINHK